VKLLFLSFGLGAVVLAARVNAGPPRTRVEPVKEMLHGVEVVDPYRWLEGDNSDPERMGAMNDEVAAWTDAQNAWTRSVLDGLPGRKALEDRLRPLLEVDTVSSPIARADRYFFTRREGSQDQPVWYWREGYRGESRVLLDPKQLDASGLTTVAWVSPDPEGRRVAWGSYRAGDENTTLRLMEVDSGRDLGLEIPDKVQPPQWLPDGSGFVYQKLDDPADPYSGRVLFHRIGADPGQAALLFRQYTKEENEALATTWGPGATLSRDGRWLVLYYWTGTDSNDVWLADFGRFLETGELEKREVSVGEGGTAFGTVVDGTLYLQTTKGAPRGRIVAVDAAAPALGEWREVVPEREQAVIESSGMGRGALAVQYLQEASNKVEVFDLDGKPRGALKLPGLGSTGLQSFEDRSEAYLTFTSFNFPSSIYRVDLDAPTAEPELWERPDVPVDPASVEVRQVWYPSKDGTRISMFLVHRRGLEPDGQRPVYLTGYGGFNISRTPAFSATLFQWFEAGGVYALPNLRGGGEYGKQWHRAGMLEQKQNVFDDFVAAAEWLIAEGYTNPGRLAIAGGSNGGLLTGAALTQRPELFAAVIVAVPLLDMLRYQNFLMARYWVPEYGAAEDGEQFAFLHAYSPYHRVKEGVKYPAVLLTAGENDSRVHPLHARKMAALLQARSASDPAGDPVLLWVDREAGHGQGKPLNLVLRDVVDQRIFVMWQLGLLPEADGAS
jgi:prolyl oligopeptidase